MARKTSWQTELKKHLRRYCRRAAYGDKGVSSRTTEHREEVILRGFRDLRKMGVRLDYPDMLTVRHVKMLIKHWVGKALSPKTISIQVSVFRGLGRTFPHPLQIPGTKQMLEGIVIDIDSYCIPTATKTDKSWQGQGINYRTKLNQVKESDPRVAALLLLQRIFGLRCQEALKLKPHLADKVHYLDISRGTKGGRPRTVAIDTPEKRETIDYVKQFAAQKTSSMIPDGKKYESWRRRYYHVLERAGIVRKNGLTSHGLRHEAVQEMYLEGAGQECPVRGGNPSAIDRCTRDAVRIDIAENLGHSRPSVTCAYLGGFSKPKTQSRGEYQSRLALRCHDSVVPAVLSVSMESG